MQATIQKRVTRVRTTSGRIERLAHEVVDTHSHFYRRAGQFQFCCRDSVLIVRGSVPSFYLKQVLQRALQEVNGISRIDNQVTVVSAFGLSSIETDAD